MDPVLNPFRPGAGTNPPELAGRDDLLEGVDDSLSRLIHGAPGEHTVSVGLRGVGKTVLLNAFEGMASERGFGVIHLEASEDKRLGLQLATKARQFLLSERRPDRMRSALTRALRVLSSFSLALPGDITLSFDVEPLIGTGDSGDFETDLTELLVALGEACAEATEPLLISLDEIQYLTGPDLGALTAALHRCNQLTLPVMLVGAGLPNTLQLLGDTKSYSERLYSFRQIGPLSMTDAEAALSIPARGAGGDFTGEALREVVALTEGYPYFLQEYGFALWNGSEYPEITLADVAAQGGEIQARLDESFFAVRLERSTEDERVVLRTLADLHPRRRIPLTIATSLASPVQDLKDLLTSLEGKGIIYQDVNGIVHFTVPQFAPFVKRQFGTEEDWVRDVMDIDFGLDLPRRLVTDFITLMRQDGYSDLREIPVARLWRLFASEYHQPPQSLVSMSPDFEVSTGGGRTTVRVQLTHDGKSRAAEGIGNGPIDALVNAIHSATGIKLEVKDYSEHALSQGVEQGATAVAYVECSVQGRYVWGLWNDSSILDASLGAVINAADHHLRRAIFS